MNSLNLKLLRMLFFAAGLCVISGCAVERWQLSTVSRKPDFEILKPSELFAQPEHRSGTNGLIYVQPAANLIDYAYDARNRALEVTVEVNRNHTITLAGSRPGSGKEIRLLNLKNLSRSIRLRDSTGSLKIGWTVALPPAQGHSKEYSFTVLLGLLLDKSGETGPNAKTKPGMAATLQSLLIYDLDRNLIVAEWTRQPEPVPELPAER